jgi:hypothetical protein
MAPPRASDKRKAKGATTKGKAVDAAPTAPRSSLKRKQPSSSASNGTAALKLGELELDDHDDGSEEEDGGEGSSAGGSSGEEESFPELNVDDSSGDEDEEEEDGDDEEDEAALLRELAEEEALERELANSEASSLSGSNESESDDEDASSPADKISRLIARNTTKPNEDDTTPATSLDETSEKSKLLGFDTRDFKDRAKKVTSEITGEDRFVWEDIEPGYASDSEQEEVRKNSSFSFFFFRGKLS